MMMLPLARSMLRTVHKYAPRVGKTIPVYPGGENSSLNDQDVDKMSPWSSHRSLLIRLDQAYLSRVSSPGGLENHQIPL